MSKATLAFGGTVTEADLARLVTALCLDGECVATEEFTEYSGDEPPSLTGDDDQEAWYLYLLREAAAEGRPFVLTSWGGEDTKILAANLTELLAELELPLRSFQPATKDVWGDMQNASLVVLRLGELENQWCPAGANGLPMIELNELLAKDSQALADAAALAWKIYSTPLPPLVIVP